MKQYSKSELMELAPGYALGALSPEEMAAVDAALANDTDLRREVAAYHDVAGTVLASEPPFAPSPALRARWMQRVRGEGTASDARRSASRGAAGPRRPSRSSA